MASSDSKRDSIAGAESESNGGTFSSIPSTVPERWKVALVTDITGQDGSYLTEFLLGKGYEVHGLIRCSSNYNTARLNHICVDSRNSSKARTKLHYADLSEASSLRSWVDSILPDKVYNLTAQSHVAVSFEISDYTADIIATGSLRLLEAVRSSSTSFGKPICCYQANSSEMFGSTPPPSPSPHPSTPFPHTPPPRSSPTGTASTTARPAVSSPATASSSTTRAPTTRRTSSHTRSPAPSVGSALACRPSFSSGIYRLPTTGASPGTTSRPCGSCCSRTSPTLSFLPEPIAVAASTRGLLYCRGRVSGGYYICNPTTIAWEFFFV